MTNEFLVKQIVNELQVLPESLLREVLDFIRYLQTKYDSGPVFPQDSLVSETDREEALLATFGAWEDEREAEEIVQDIYSSRTVSELEISGMQFTHS